MDRKKPKKKKSKNKNTIVKFGKVEFLTKFNIHVLCHYSFHYLLNYLKRSQIMNLSRIHVSYNFHSFPSIFGQITELQKFYIFCVIKIEIFRF